MTLSRRHLLQSAGLGALSAAGLLPAAAKPIDLARMIVGFPAGSSIDALARALSKRLVGSYAGSVIVDNKPGAAGQLGAVAARSAPADGSAMFLAPMSVLGVYPSTYKSLAYDPVADFTPVTNLVAFNYGLAVGSMVPASVTTVPQLVEWFKANPDKRSIGNPAVGSTLHFTAMLFAKTAQLELQHVPYVGGAMFNDLIGGTLPACVSTLGSLLPLHHDGRLRILATTGESRSSFLPSVPNFVEAGFKDLVFREWMGLFLPARASAEAVRQLNQAARTALAGSEVQEILSRAAQEAEPSSPEELAALLRKDTEAWRQRVRSVGFAALS